jgi:hypothetical protein
MGNFSLLFILCLGVVCSVVVGSYSIGSGDSHRVSCTSSACNQ